MSEKSLGSTTYLPSLRDVARTLPIARNLHVSMHQGYGGDETQQVVEAEKYQALEGQVRALIERVKALKGQNKVLKDQTRATEADRARLKAQVDDLQQVGQMRCSRPIALWCWRSTIPWSGEGLRLQSNPKRTLIQTG
jgi:predicted nuclease with TOPRIM domain